MFSRKFLIKTLLKKRFFRPLKKSSLRYGSIGLYCLAPFRFEYRYKLFFRKFFKRVITRRKRPGQPCRLKKTWLFIRPNYVLTRKSKNSRMGKGKGKFKRWCTVVHPGRIFIEHLNVSHKVYMKYRYTLQCKLKIPFKINKLSNSFIKHPSFNNNIKVSGALSCVKFRKALFLTQRLFRTHI